MNDPNAGRAAADASSRAGTFDISWMSSGASRPASELGMETPSPGGGTKRSASPAGAAVPPRAGRSPSPWPNPGLRSMHRRVEFPPTDGAPEILLKAVQQQQEYDWEFMESLKEAVVVINDRVMGHDKNISKWRGWNEDNARKLVELEGRVHRDNVDEVTKMRGMMEQEFENKFPPILQT